MTNVRFRNTGLKNPSGIKLRRNLSIEWYNEELIETNILKINGDFNRAITFGDPNIVNPQSHISFSNINFNSFKLNNLTSLESSTGKLHKVIDGPFFNLKSNTLTHTEDFFNLTTLGSWIPNLPPSEALLLKVSELTPDNVYQIRCIFFNGKNKGTSKVILTPDHHELEINNTTGIIAIGTFIAPIESIIIQIRSEDSKPPFINAMTLHTIGKNSRNNVMAKLL